MLEQRKPKPSGPVRSHTTYDQILKINRGRVTQDGAVSVAAPAVFAIIAADTILGMLRDLEKLFFRAFAGFAAPTPYFHERPAV